jgi:hypothetical protein
MFGIGLGVGMTCEHAPARGFEGGEGRGRVPGETEEERAGEGAP